MNDYDSPCHRQETQGLIQMTNPGLRVQRHSGMHRGVPAAHRHRDNPSWEWK